MHLQHLCSHGPHLAKERLCAARCQGLDRLHLVYMLMAWLQCSGSHINNSHCIRSICCREGLTYTLGHESMCTQSLSKCTPNIRKYKPCSVAVQPAPEIRSRKNTLEAEAGCTPARVTELPSDKRTMHYYQPSLPTPQHANIPRAEMRCAPPSMATSSSSLTSLF
jgi:hypothetical protein